jgi:hypothetical protein
MHLINVKVFGREIDVPLSRNRVRMWRKMLKIYKELVILVVYLTCLPPSKAANKHRP